MTAEEFLKRVVTDQTLVPDSPEYVSLEAEHTRITKLLERELNESEPSISIGASRRSWTLKAVLSGRKMESALARDIATSMNFVFSTGK